MKIKYLALLCAATFMLSSCGTSGTETTKEDTTIETTEETVIDDNDHVDENAYTVDFEQIENSNEEMFTLDDLVLGDLRYGMPMEGVIAIYGEPQDTSYKESEKEQIIWENYNDITVFFEQSKDNPEIYTLKSVYASIEDYMTGELRDISAYTGPRGIKEGTPIKEVIAKFKVDRTPYIKEIEPEILNGLTGAVLYANAENADGLYAPMGCVYLDEEYPGTHYVFYNMPIETEDGTIKHAEISIMFINGVTTGFMWSVYGF